MTLTLSTFLIGLATVLFLSCLYTTISHDKHTGLIEFLMIEVLRLEGVNGNVMIEDRETGDTWFCSKEYYEKNRSKYELINDCQPSDMSKDD